VETQRREQPFLNRALRRIRNVWSELASSRSAGVQKLRPDLPPADLETLRGLMAGCLEEQGVATAARAQAAKLGSIYLTLDETGRRRFLELLTEAFDLDARSLAAAVEVHLRDPGTASYAQVQESVRPPRVQLLKMFNALPDGFKFLVDMRADLMSFLDDEPSLQVLDHDLKALFEAWFDVGLLSFVDIDWGSPASLLEKVMAYEAVHEIRSWEDLKNRLDTDRRCYAFFHPKIPDEPLIFVEVALTQGMPERIEDLLDVSAPVTEASEADTAVFYSISNTQEGLRGVSFGSFLLKQVMDRLAAQHPGLETFVTLSPIPGFRRWLLRALGDGRVDRILDDAKRSRLAKAVEEAGAASVEALLEGSAWYHDETVAGALEEPLRQLCTHYLLHERNGRGEPLDPVERFHIANGARVERLNWRADESAKGLEESFGMMVSYLYEADRIEDHYELAVHGTIAASPALQKLDRANRRLAA
jgi:malonyl-CoA decarboxylase